MHTCTTMYSHTNIKWVAGCLTFVVVAGYPSLAVSVLGAPTREAALAAPAVGGP